MKHPCHLQLCSFCFAHWSYGFLHRGQKCMPLLHEQETDSLCDIGDESWDHWWVDCEKQSWEHQVLFSVGDIEDEEIMACNGHCGVVHCDKQKQTTRLWYSWWKLWLTIKGHWWTRSHAQQQRTPWWTRFQTQWIHEQWPSPLENKSMPWKLSNVLSLAIQRVWCKKCTNEKQLPNENQAWIEPEKMHKIPFACNGQFSWTLSAKLCVPIISVHEFQEVHFS